MNNLKLLIFTALCMMIFSCETARTEVILPKVGDVKVPGVVVNYSPAYSLIYLGTPSIVILEDGSYLVSLDYFGPKSEYATNAKTDVFKSRDKGNTWHKVASIHQFWSNLFLHNGSVYIMGVDNSGGSCIIRRSDDGGETWTEAKDSHTGILLPKTSEYGYHTSAVSMIEYNGRLWRPMEITRKHRVGSYDSMMLSAPVDSDLLDARSWTKSEALVIDSKYVDLYRNWLEGGAVLDKDGNVSIILRVDRRDKENAAIIKVVGQDKLVFDPNRDFIDFPGGCKKFVVRYDPDSELYWSLTNWVPEKYSGGNVERTRNTLALVSSHDLLQWRVHEVVLQNDDVERVGFQYVDWQFEGNDIVFVSRTSFFDGVNDASSQHNSNYITFHRIKKFRQKSSTILWENHK